MPLLLSLIVFCVLLAGLPSLTPAATTSATQGVALTSLYWDCCKASCSWEDHGSFVGNPVNTCGINGTRQTDWNLGSGCGDGESFSCQDQTPWSVNNTFSYGFVGALIDGYLERTWCCGCYELEFTTAPVKGKRIVVQASNSNYDSTGHSVFNIGIPGGYDYASACAKQFGQSDINGKENDGVLTRDQCDLLPDTLRSGCYWRFDWLLNARKPNATWKRTACPTQLTDISGCIRQDEAEFVADSDTPPESEGEVTSGIASLSEFHSFALSLLQLVTVIVALML